MSISGITKFKPRKSKAQDDMEKFRDLRNHVGETCRISRQNQSNSNRKLWEWEGPWACHIESVAADGRNVCVDWAPPGGPNGENSYPWVEANTGQWRVEDVVAPKANTITVTLPNFDGKRT